MKIYKPLWEEGLLLSPQHFQQQNQYEEFVSRSLIKMLGKFQWGIFDQSFDYKAIEAGKLKLDAIQLCFPDGTFVDTRLTGANVSTRNLSDIPSDKNRIDIYLAIPIWQSNSTNLVSDSDNLAAPKRFVKRFERVMDMFSNEEVELSVEQYNLQLRFDFEANDEYITCPIARLVRNENGRLMLDINYIPPLLLMAGSQWLVAYLKRISSLLMSRIDSLSARRRVRGGNLVDFSVSDSTLFWFLHGLNSIYPELMHLTRYPEKHPEELYKLLSHLLGMLYTYRIEESVADIDVYNHVDLYGTFSRLENKIRSLLDEVIPSPVIEINLEHFKTTQWRAQIFDSRIDDKTEFYLSAHSDSISFLELQKQLPLISKIGAPEDVERVINTAVLGVPLHLLNQTPPGLPFRMDNAYFKLDRHHPAFQRMMKTQACSIYVPASITNLHLNLYAVVSI
ncbi:type VI secretion system baseplate subunit TssK [Neisseria sp. MVDL20-010259]|uniref:type VI secretion system baseplate subunit TssK n=1 Tax=Neisseria sp. MVDL20-010259 TaxID=3061170 RepID=UPI00265E80FB|nr:type VI secretion system baseplate subunit TssK [Neisseria sp. MVDL20-010259]MDO1562661.1 type VI secretion system baseplate subunit TssK [Neisseria sp. MVDL20-010259]